MIKNNIQTNVTTLLLLLLISSWSLAASASNQSIGKVILAVGEVTATDTSGVKRKLKRRSKIFSGDTLSTKSDSRCQIRFSDKSLVALTASTQFKVDQYQFNQEKKPSGEKAIYSLLKGGMRSISGAIGKTNREDYKLKTPVATIGVRGTTFNIGLIDEDGIPSLYGTVDDGSIAITNSQGELILTPGQNFQASMNQPPRLIISLPISFPSNKPKKEKSLEEGNGDGSGTSDKEPASDGEREGPAPEQGDGLTEFSGIDNGGELPPPEDGAPLPPPPPPPPPLPDDPVTTTGTYAPAGAAVGFALVGTNGDGIANKNIIFYNKGSDEIYIDTIGGVGNVPVAGAFYDGDCNPCAFISATGTLGATAGYTDTGIAVNWGRWSGDYVVAENGIPSTNMGDFHYIYSPNVTSLQNLTGNRMYSLPGSGPGGTTPTDQNGNPGTLNWLNISVDLSNQEITNFNMNLTTPDSVTISATSSNIIPFDLNEFASNGIAIDATNGFTTGLNGYVGEIQGTFVGPGTFTTPGEDGLMTTYGFREDATPSTKAISGTALLLELGPQ